MEPTESITNMFTRFTDIINNLKSLDENYINGKLVRKILRSLLTNWEAKMTVIQKTKDLNKLALEELIGSLMTHELSINQNAEKKMKRKTIALKLSTMEELESESCEDSENEDEMTMITRRFKWFIRRKNFFPRRKNI